MYSHTKVTCIVLKTAYSIILIGIIKKMLCSVHRENQQSLGVNKLFSDTPDNISHFTQTIL